MGFLSRLFGNREAPAPAPRPAAPPPPREPEPTPREMSADELREMLASDNPPLLIDVREHQELLMEGWIPGARHLPLSSLQGRHEEVPGMLPRDRTIVVNCAGGVRSHDFGCFLMEHGFTDVVNLTGGIHAWSHERERGDELPALET